MSTTGVTAVGVAGVGADVSATGVGVVGIVGVDGVVGVTGGGATVQSALNVAPLGVVVGAVGKTGVGACVCPACGVTLVQTCGIVQTLAISFLFSFFIQR